MEDGSYRKTKFYEILGKEYIPYAFQCAHEADPEAELYYNDYGMNVPGRRDSVAALVRSLKEKGTASMPSACRDIWAWTIPRWKTLRRACSPLHHRCQSNDYRMGHGALPTVSHTANISDTAAYRKALNPYPETLPDSVSRIWNARMKSFFDLFLKHADVITRVTHGEYLTATHGKTTFPCAAAGNTRYCSTAITSPNHSYANCCKHPKT